MNKTALLAIGLLIFTSTAFAATESNASYSADSIVTVDNKTVKSRIYHTRGKERREAKVKNGHSIVISRQDKKKIWMLMPERKTYMEMPVRNSHKSAEPNFSSAHVTPLGPETVNGLHTEKYKVTTQGKRGEKVNGFMWKTPDGIVVKYDVTSTGSSHDGHVTMELRNIQVGKQDPALFEIPSGYSPMDLKGMMIGAGIAAGEERHRAHVKRHNEHMDMFKGLGIPAP